MRCTTVLFWYVDGDWQFEKNADGSDKISIRSAHVAFQYLDSNSIYYDTRNQCIKNMVTKADTLLSCK